VRISALARELGVGELTGDVEVFGASSDSRTCRPGDLFLAIHGDRHDGHVFCAEAVSRGATALVVERSVAIGVPQICVPSVLAVAGPLSSLLYGAPSEQIPVVGVTGTNGKTTTCQLLRACLGAPDGLAGQVSTTGVHLGERLLATSSLSTPEAPDLQRLLAAMVSGGARGVAVEVSSHGLVRRRVDGTCFRVGVFLNLSPEHLDFHGTMTQYFEAKSRLFEPERCQQAIVCVDDEWGRRLANTCRTPVTTFGRHPSADVKVAQESRGLGGLTVRLRSASGEVALESPLVGRVNATNIAAAYLAAQAAGVAVDAAVAAIASCAPPPGRFEIVTSSEPFLVAVDYAHTPDALEALIETARELTGSSVRLVLGARGERYAAKRPALARQAVQADEVLLTTEAQGANRPR
jgi:UDP-N-acetylmuramoyl-L-alanyl-D-glutamate--2,6-diaminopimelate ligase